MAQAALGGVISEVVSKNAEAGAGAASSATKNNDLDQELSAEFGHIPKTEKEVMEGEEQNLDNKYEITMEDLSNAIFSNFVTTTGDKGLEELLSKEFPDYTRIESYPESNVAFRVYYPSGGKMVASVLRNVPITSTCSVLIKVSNDYIDKKDVDWKKEIGKFLLVDYVSGHASKATNELTIKAVSSTAGKIVSGTAGVAVGIIVSGVVEVSVEKIYTRISDFINGGVPLD